MKKDFCIDCKFVLERKLTKKGGYNSTSNKTCPGCSRIIAPRASRTPMRSKKK